MRLAAAASGAVVGVAAFGVAAPGLHGRPSPRRFTGSFFAGGAGANDFPVTAFLADDPPPVDVAAWRLRVGGRVARPLLLTLEELTANRRTGSLAVATETLTTRPTMLTDLAAPAIVGGGVLSAFGQTNGAKAVVRAVIDCTGGWCADRVWTGMALGSLLDAAGASGDATIVVVHSVTGYLTALPIAEARAALLATHVGGQPLAHGHGFPLRLVAPERRGFEWVKWVDEIRVW